MKFKKKKKTTLSDDRNIYLFFFLWAERDPCPLSSLEDVSLESLLELEVEQDDESDATPVERVGSTWSAISAKAGSFSCIKEY